MPQPKETKMGWFTQDESSDSATKVKSGENADTGQAQTEFLIIDKSDGGNHTHIAISDTGDTTYGRSAT